MTDDRPRCDHCGKVIFRTWREARINAVGYMFTRKGARGFRVYHSRRCACFHVGRATDHQRRRATRREVYA